MKTLRTISLKGLLILTLAPFAVSTSAQAPASGTVMTLPVDDATLTRDGDMMKVDMELLLDRMEMKGSKAILLTPMIVNGDNSLDLQQVGLYSRTRWYQYERKEKGFLGNPDEIVLKWKERPQTMEYTQSVPYQDWMNGATLMVHAEEYGCCYKITDEDLLPLGSYIHKEYEPYFVYIQKVADVEKTAELSGRAYVDFVVNRTEIQPDYRNNRVELNKIIATIDSVKNDPDVTVTSIFINGTASPEGPYANNVRLAMGRTDALIAYVQKLYNFPAGLIKSAYEPVDWAGLREYLLTSSLQHRTEMLDIIDSNEYGPEVKNNMIKTKWPSEYRFLLDNVYPGLRHSDYKIEYTIRTFTDIEEIKAMLRTAPQKLSLNEMYFLASSYEQGSDEFNEVFETAVRLFPDDETANLNAAVSAMQRGDLVSAARFLPKAGNSPEAIYSRAVLAALNKNNVEAIQLFEKVQDVIPQSTEAIEILQQP